MSPETWTETRLRDSVVLLYPPLIQGSLHGGQVFLRVLEAGQRRADAPAGFCGALLVADSPVFHKGTAPLLLGSTLVS